jgi:hypothetical protein
LAQNNTKKEATRQIPRCGAEIKLIIDIKLDFMRFLLQIKGENEQFKATSLEWLCLRDVCADFSDTQEFNRKFPSLASLLFALAFALLVNFLDERLLSPKKCRKHGTQKHMFSSSKTLSLLYPRIHNSDAISQS